ncbi:hypothetical protein FB41_1286, partial [Cutibacterium acnes]
KLGTPIPDAGGHVNQLVVMLLTNTALSFMEVIRARARPMLIARG